MKFTLLNFAISMLIFGVWTTIGIAMAVSPGVPVIWKVVCIYFGFVLGLMFWASCPWIEKD